MECSKIKQLLSEYIDNSLDLATKTFIKRHLSQCSACSEEFASLKAYLKEMSSLGEVKAPDDFLEKVHQRISRRFEFEKMMRKIFVPVKVKVPLQLAAVMAMLIVGVFVYKIMPSSEQKKITAREKSASLELAGARERREEFYESTITREEEAVPFLKKREPIKLVLYLRPQLPADEALGPKPREDFDISTQYYSPSVYRGIEPTATESPPPLAQESTPELVESIALSKVRQLTETLEGKILLIKYKKLPSVPQFITVEIPAKNYSVFLDKLDQLGDFSMPLPSISADMGESISLQLEFLTFQ